MIDAVASSTSMSVKMTLAFPGERVSKDQMHGHIGGGARSGIVMSTWCNANVGCVYEISVHNGKSMSGLMSTLGPSHHDTYSNGALGSAIFRRVLTAGSILVET